ncbi:MAG: RHS repeat-associated core domain-containing protein, partial [Opitutales bacterium]|nr:RHS repeat-associated core domain-containing protein [Opitutales bacterium]
KYTPNVLNQYSERYVPNTSLIDTVTHRNDGVTQMMVSNTHDKLGRLVNVLSNPSASLAISALYEFNDLNQRTRMTREDNSYWIYDYDDLGQVTDAHKKDSSGGMIPSFDFGFKYDDIGNRKSATRVNEGNAQDVIQKYTPNVLNQYSERYVPNLIDVVGTANADAQVLVNGRQVTRSGDLFHKQLVVDNTSDVQWFPLDVIAHDSVAGTYRKESGNQFLPKSPVEPQHDEDGNLTQDARWDYTWDGENRLIAMETRALTVSAGVPQQKLEFAYDGQSRRIQKKVSSWTGSSWMPDQDTRFIWDGWNLITELDALNTYAAINTYVWGLDLSGSMQGAGGVGGLLFIENTSKDFIPAYDGNGNVLAYVNAITGETEAEYEYGAFGETLRTEGETADDFNFQFSTKYVDAETRLYYYGYRYYDPETGRWPNRDPLQEDGGVNLYGFVVNNPISLIDILGLQFIDGGFHYVSQANVPAPAGQNDWWGATKWVSKQVPVGKDEIEEFQGNDDEKCFCARIKSAQSFKIKVSSYVANDIVGSKVTQSGLKAIIDHERKRKSSVEDAYYEYIDPIDKTWYKQCNPVCSKKEGKAKEKLADWIKDVRKAAWNKYISYVRNSMTTISKDNINTNHIMDPNGLLDGYNRSYTVNPPKPMKVKKCPKA